MGFWNYRIIHNDDGTQPRYGVYEVMYDDDGTVQTYSAEPDRVYGDTPEEVVSCVQQMLHDVLAQPVLNASDLKANIEAWEAKLDEEIKDARMFDSAEEFIAFLNNDEPEG